MKHKIRTSHQIFPKYPLILIVLLIAEIMILRSHQMVVLDFFLAAFVTIGIQLCLGMATVLLLSRKMLFPNAWLGIIPTGLSANAVITGCVFSQNAAWLYYLVILSSCLIIVANRRLIKPIFAEITKNESLLNILIFIIAIFIFVYTYDRGPWLIGSGGRLTLNFYWDQLGYLGELQQMNSGLIPDLPHLRLSGYHESILYNARSYQYLLLFKILNIDVPTLFFGFHKLWMLITLSLAISFLTYSYRKKTLDVILANMLFFVLPAIVEPISGDLVFFYSDFFQYLSRSASAMLAITVIITAIAFFLAGLKQKKLGSLIFSSILFGLLLFVRGPFYLVMFPAYCLSLGLMWLLGGENPRFSAKNHILRTLIFSVGLGLSLTIYLFVIKSSSTTLGSNSIDIQFGLYAKYVSTDILARYKLGILFNNLIKDTSETLQPFLIVNFFLLSRCLFFTFLSFIFCFVWKRKQLKNPALMPLFILIISTYIFTLIYCLTLVQIDKGAFSAWQVVGSMPSLIYFFDPFFSAMIIAIPAQALIKKLDLKSKYQIHSQILDYTLLFLIVFALYANNLTIQDHLDDTVHKQDYDLLRSAQKILPKEAVIGSLSRIYTNDDKVAAFSGRSSFIARSPEMLIYYPQEAHLRFEVLKLFSENLNLEQKLALAKAYNITHLFVSADQKDEAPVFEALKRFSVGDAILYDLESSYKTKVFDWEKYLKWLDSNARLNNTQLLIETRFIQAMGFANEDLNLFQKIDKIIEKKWQFVLKDFYNKDTNSLINEQSHFLAILSLTAKNSYLIFHNSAKVKFDWKTGWGILVDNERLLDIYPFYNFKKGQVRSLSIIEINTPSNLLSKKEVKISLWEWSKLHINSEHVPISTLPASHTEEQYIVDEQ